MRAFTLMPILVSGALAAPALPTAPLPTAPAGAQEAQETETVNRTVALPANGTVELHNFSGDVRITAGSGNDVVIEAVRRAPRERLDHIALDVATSGSTVTIDANKRDADWEDRDNNVVETEFDIQVPASANLTVEVFSSDVTIAGVTGRQELKTFSGHLIVRGARGAINAESFNGDVEIDLSGAGATPDLTVETFSGRITADLPDDARGTIRFNSFSGDLDSDLDLSISEERRGRVVADLPGGSGGTLSFRTFSADLRIR